MLIKCHHDTQVANQCVLVPDLHGLVPPFRSGKQTLRQKFRPRPFASCLDDPIGARSVKKSPAFFCLHHEVCKREKCMWASEGGRNGAVCGFYKTRQVLP